MSTRPPVVVDHKAATIDVNHWGYTLRTLFGAALAHNPVPPGQRKPYTLRLKGTPIATLNVQKHDDQT
jgi:hypothetical protein